MTGTLYDLVLRGGRVIDPAQGIDAALDVGIRAGRVEAVAPALSLERRVRSSTPAAGSSFPV